jgi:glycosyltransferase involved in cell wall biosynthesis
MPIYRLGFVMEQTLGHVTHDRNLRHWVAADGNVVPEWMPVPFEARDVWQRVPNWTLRASLRAKALAAAALEHNKLDGLFFHTQSVALFAGRFMRRLPSIVSLDATPINLDSVGEAYNHKTGGNRLVEALKRRLTRRSFREAKHLITWCEWAKKSLVEDYGIAPEKVTVIPPGVDMGRWRFERFPQASQRPLRLLFVGGDFRRKGGEVLLRAFHEALAERCELDIVTRDPVDTGGSERVRVRGGLAPNSPELMALFEEADIFVFPTLGDCLPIAVMEAMASELPVVATCVGALEEEVEDGVTGCLVPPGDAEALADSVLRLARDTDLRRQMGWAGRRRAEEKFDGARNYRTVIELYKRCVDGRC